MRRRAWAHTPAIRESICYSIISSASYNTNEGKKYETPTRQNEKNNNQKVKKEKARHPH